MIAVLRACLVALLLTSGPALAVQPDEVLKDPALEARARALSLDLRCLVCQNQSIDDSNAPLAKDLRVLVRERLVAGDTDSQVIDYVVARYGEFVLLRPRFTAQTAVLWLAPAVLLILGALIVYRMFGRPKAESKAAAMPLDASEAARLKALLDPDRTS